MIATIKCLWEDVTGVAARRKIAALEDRLALVLTNLRAATMATDEQRKRKENTIKMYGGLLQQKSDELTTALNSLNEVLQENVKLQQRIGELEQDMTKVYQLREVITADDRDRKIRAVKDAVRSSKVIPLNGIKTEVKK